jgi:hypothetical protein
MRVGRVTGLLVLVGWLLACGGRLEKSGSASGDDDGGSSAAHAGAPHATGGAASGAGAASRGGAASGGGCACDAFACGPGYEPVTNLDGCCFHCAAVLPSCDQQRQSYAELKKLLLDKFSTLSCVADTDCGIYYDQTGCGASCGVPIPNAARRNIDDSLYAFAEANCSPVCPPLPVPPCAPSPPPRCVAGRCQ